MIYQLLFSIIFLFLLTINPSLTLSFLEKKIDISKHHFDKSYLPKISVEHDGQHHPKWRRASQLFHSRSDMMNKDKARSRVLTYDFLLHKWFLRRMSN